MEFAINATFIFLFVTSFNLLMLIPDRYFTNPIDFNEQNHKTHCVPYFVLELFSLVYKWSFVCKRFCNLSINSKTIEQNTN